MAAPYSTIQSRHGNASKGEESASLTIVVIGRGGNGKTKLIVRLVDNVYDDTYVPTQLSVYTCKLGNMSLNIYDTEGQETYTEDKEGIIYQRSDAAILVVGVDSTLDENIPLINAYRREKDSEDVPFFLCISKTDMKWTLSREELENFKKEYNFSTHFETSAFNNADKNVENMFKCVAEEVMKYRKKFVPEVAEIQLTKPAKRRKKKFLCFWLMIIFFREEFNQKYFCKFYLQVKFMNSHFI